jgi:hypothetical protein
MIRDGRLLYHLTALENLESIFHHGLQPRCELSNDEFENVADGEILDSRANHDLDSYVPFHFFSRTPFDYGVQRAYPERSFVLITIRREVARANGWLIVPTHPLAEEGFQILNYDTGFAAIDWDLMEERDYDVRACKVACMAECLSPTSVNSNLIFCIYVKDARIKAVVDRLVNLHNVNCHVNINSAMFVGE